jgi:hypothetical protein
MGSHSWPSGESAAAAGLRQAGEMEKNDFVRFDLSQVSRDG